MANSHLAEMVSVKFAAQPQVCTALCRTSKQVVNLSVHSDGRSPSTGIPEVLDTEASFAEI
jgi:hypothetical protein